MKAAPAGIEVVPTSRYLLFGAIACFGCAIDLLTKKWAFDRLGMPHQRPSLWLVDEIFGFTTSLNEGALFGFGQGQGLLFSGLSFAAGVGIFYWLFVAGAAHNRLLTAALGCVTGGIMGNLYDRLGLPGLTWNRESATCWASRCTPFATGCTSRSIRSSIGRSSTLPTACWFAARRC